MFGDRNPVTGIDRRIDESSAADEPCDATLSRLGARDGGEIGSIIDLGVAGAGVVDIRSSSSLCLLLLLLPPLLIKLLCVTVSVGGGKRRRMFDKLAMVARRGRLHDRSMGVSSST